MCCGIGIYILFIFCEPYGREVAPAKLAYDGVAALREGIANVDRVIAALAVVLPVLLVFGHDGLGVRRI